MFRFSIVGNINGFYWVVTVMFIELFSGLPVVPWHSECFCLKLKQFSWDQTADLLTVEGPRGSTFNFKMSFISAFCSYILITVCSRLGVLDIYRSVVKRVWKAPSMQKWEPVYTGDLCISNASLMLSCFRWDQKQREGSWLFPTNVTLHYSTVTVSFVLSK